MSCEMCRASSSTESNEVTLKKSRCFIPRQVDDAGAEIPNRSHRGERSKHGPPIRRESCAQRQWDDHAEHCAADGDCAEDDRMFLASSRLISEGEVTAQEVSRAVNRWDYHCIPARDGRDICDAGKD